MSKSTLKAAPAISWNLAPSAPLGKWACLMPPARKYYPPSTATPRKPYPLKNVPRLRLWEFGQLNPGLGPFPTQAVVKETERTLYLKNVPHNDTLLSRYYPLYINPWEGVDLINAEIRGNPEVYNVSFYPMGWTFWGSRFTEMGLRYTLSRRIAPHHQEFEITRSQWFRKRRRSRGPLITFWDQTSNRLLRSVDSREWAYEKPLYMVKMQDLLWGLELVWESGEARLRLNPQLY